MIRKWLQKLFGWPCDHDWETLQNGSLWSTRNYLLSDEGAPGQMILWLYRCKKCCKKKRITTQP